MAGDISYSGDSSYRFVDRMIDGGTSTLRIVSPFISVSYADRLLRAARGRRVYVITSGSHGNDEAVGVLVKGRRTGIFRPAAYLTVLSAALYLFKLYLFATVSLLMLVLFGYAAVARRRRRLPNLHVKVVTNRFIHEKLYLTDEEAVVGSANLTYSGMHKNIEHIDVTRDQAKVTKLTDHFNELWSKY